MIKPGLERITRLCLSDVRFSPCIHVAGTNGKGSICAYINSILTDAGFRVGKFTSPHLIDRRDSITINGTPISQSAFDKKYAFFQETSERGSIGASPFELLTATAFRAFQDAECDICVVECGMGGGRDATNVIHHEKKIAAVISKVGLDHQDFLGNTIEEITREKCGIFGREVRVIFDDTNNSDVLRVIRHEADMAHAHIVYPWDKTVFKTGLLADSRYSDDNVRAILRQSRIGSIPYQVTNAELAFRAAYQFIDRWVYDTRSTRQDYFLAPNPQAMLESIITTEVAGRFQAVSLNDLLGTNRSIILDGAHNPQAIEATAPLLMRLGDVKPNGTRHPISWIIAFSEGKALDQMLAPLIRPGDTVAAVEFGPVDGMPWKKAMPSREITHCLESLRSSGVHVDVQDFERDIKRALLWSCSQAPDNPLVTIGSLYLVSDILRLIETSGQQIQLLSDDMM